MNIKQKFIDLSSLQIIDGSTLRFACKQIYYKNLFLYYFRIISQGKYHFFLFNVRNFFFQYTVPVNGRVPNQRPQPPQLLVLVTLLLSWLIERDIAHACHCLFYIQLPPRLQDYYIITFIICLFINCTNKIVTNKTKYFCDFSYPHAVKIKCSRGILHEV